MNDQLLALLRTGWQGVVASALAFLLTLGIEIDTAAAFAVTWPIVMFVYYWASQQVISRISSTKLAVALTGPGRQPTYDEVIEGLTGEKP